MPTYRQATFDRRSLKRRSIRRQGQHAGWIPDGVEHGVDFDLPEAERVTLCGIPAVDIWVWPKPFEHTLNIERCDDCNAAYRQLVGS